MFSSYSEKIKFNPGMKSLKSWELEWNETPGIRTVLVIPAICEFENIKCLLHSLAKNDKACLQSSLIIFVINNSVSSDSKIQSDNKSSLELLRNLLEKNTSDQFLNLIANSGLRIGLIDACTEGKQFDDNLAGVGLARKIGMDSALRVFDYSISGKKLIISLDADCTVDENYLKEIYDCFINNNFSAAIVDFEHHLPENAVERIGIISYEIFLRHYVAGLLFANSPFAFHTIGSTIVCDSEAYLKVGGMNTKKAAEDFYFLQKLAKHYRINRITSTKVKASARQSWRVPFGTGKTIVDILSKKKNILLFNPRIFQILKDWLELLYSDSSLNSDVLVKESKNIHNELYNFLLKRGFRDDWQNILKNSKSEKQIDYQRKNWFDAFETLKLVHHLRDTSFPMMQLKTGVKNLFNLTGHSVEIESANYSADTENTYKVFLSELKRLENNLFTRFYK